jgi:hypothetical protein
VQVDLHIVIVEVQLFVGNGKSNGCQLLTCNSFASIRREPHPGSKIAIPITCIGIIFYMQSLSLPSSSSLWLLISSSRLALAERSQVH